MWVMEKSWLDFILPKGESLTPVPALSQMKRIALERLCIAPFNPRQDWLALHFHNQKDKNKYLMDQLFKIASHGGRQRPFKACLQLVEQETEEWRKLVQLRFKDSTSLMQEVYLKWCTNFILRNSLERSEIYVKKKTLKLYLWQISRAIKYEGLKSSGYKLEGPLLAQNAIILKNLKQRNSNASQKPRLFVS